MKRMIRSSEYHDRQMIDQRNEAFDYLYEEAGENVIDSILEGDMMSYDDVVSETYAQIQDFAYNAHMKLSDELEDQVYEAIMEHLDDKGYIDHSRGLLL